MNNCGGCEQTITTTTTFVETKGGRLCSDCADLQSDPYGRLAYVADRLGKIRAFGNDIGPDVSKMELGTCLNIVRSLLKMHEGGLV